MSYIQDKYDVLRKSTKASILVQVLDAYITGCNNALFALKRGAMKAKAGK